MSHLLGSLCALWSKWPPTSANTQPHNLGLDIIVDLKRKEKVSISSHKIQNQQSSEIWMHAFDTVRLAKYSTVHIIELIVGEWAPKVAADVSKPYLRKRIVCPLGGIGFGFSAPSRL